MYVDIDGEEGLPWWWFGGNNNPSVGYQPDYKSNPGSNTGNNFYYRNSGPGSGNQGGGNSGYNGGNYGGSYGGNTTAAGNILFSFLSEIIYGSGSSDTKRSNPFVGLKFNPTVIQSATPARKPYTPLAKPVGTGASNVYSGGGRNVKVGSYSIPFEYNLPRGISFPKINISNPEMALVFLASLFIDVAYPEDIEKTIISRNATVAYDNSSNNYFYYVTYTKTNNLGLVYVGRSSGSPDPYTVVKNRDIGHHMKDYGASILSTSARATMPGGYNSRWSDPAYWYTRGAEQVQIVYYRKLGISGNSINGISPVNPKLWDYLSSFLDY